MGLLRNLRGSIYPRNGIRVNAICPTVTESVMTAPVLKELRGLGRLINTAEDIAKYVLDLEVSPNQNGQAIYIQGAEAGNSKKA